MSLCAENKPKKGLILRIKLDDLFLRHGDLKRSFLFKVLFVIFFLLVFWLILIQLKLLITNTRQLAKTPKNYTKPNKVSRKDLVDLKRLFNK